ncbi:MAG: UbiA family prenyltransferase [Candidatus Micrarchaeota archaeon]|nr:UbiA family prenyltransferase [Candidatus Micrarchaeota archaeon]
MQQLKTLLELVRVEHSLMLMLGAIVAIVLLGLQATLLQLVLLFSCPFLISAGAFALNDYFDAESDRINKKNRPIVRNEISKENALYLAILLLVAGVAAAYPLGVHAFSIALVFAVLSVLYDWKLKDIALIGNAIIASSMAIVFIFTEVALANSISQITVMVCAISFLTGLGREIQKTVQDVEGDVMARKAKTLPVLVGKSISLHLSALLITAASIIAIYLFLAVPPLMGNYLYLIPMLCSVLGLAYATYLSYGSTEKIEQGRKISLYSLMLGIVAFISGGI